MGPRIEIKFHQTILSFSVGHSYVQLITLWHCSYKRRISLCCLAMCDVRCNLWISSSFFPTLFSCCFVLNSLILSFLFLLYFYVKKRILHLSISLFIDHIYC